MSDSRSDTGPFVVVPVWVLDLPITDGAKLQYAVLSGYADNGTGECWPSRTTLASRLGVKVDTVDRRNRELVEAGALVVEPRRSNDGDQLSNRYQVLRVRPGGRVDAAGGSRVDAARTRPIPELELLTRESGSAAGVSEPFGAAFDAWWALYPRKVDKARARSAYTARRRSGVTAAVLLLAVENYAADRAGAEARYIKHAASFLSGDEGPWTEWVTPSDEDAVEFPEGQYPENRPRDSDW